ncbi:MAG: TAT-variant-translocated molybdopterin oxidoreductase [Polyangiaceae bacterium]
MSQVKDQPEYWRSLAELENDPEFLATVEREFKVPLDEEPGSPARRRFLQVMGASFALAGLSGCRWKEDKMVDFAKRPQGLVPGEARRYATTMELGGVATGLLVTSYDGRPIKVEGNPAHPASLGACSVWHQASILELYDPDRSQAVLKDGQKAEWKDFEAAFKTELARLKSAGGKGLYLLSSPSSSPTLADLKKRVAEKYPAAKWLHYDPVAPGDEERAGTKLAFGKPHRAQLDCSKASVILSLDADFVGPAFPMGIANARAVAEGRNPDAPKMNRLYVVESAFSHAGSIADHRLALRSELVKAFAAALDAQVGAAAGAGDAGPAQPKPSAQFLADPKVAKFIEVVAKDLVANKGASLVVAGPQQPPEVHALAARLNGLLGNAGVTVSYAEEAEAPGFFDQLKELVSALAGGQVDTLVVIGENPVYTAPVDLDFAGAYAKAKNRIAITSYVDETAKASTWHVPLAHYLETWTDTRAWDGTIAIGQPLIAPLFGGKAASEIVALLTEDVAWAAKDLVRRTHKEAIQDDRKWQKLVQTGAAAPTKLTGAAPKLQPIAPVKLEGGEAGALDAPAGQLEALFTHCSKVYDGRWANNAWLQELPEPFTKLTWGNAALFAPATAAALGVTDGTPVRLSLGGQSIELPAMIAPGQAAGSVKVALGYGRTSAGIVGGHNGDVQPTSPVGASAYKLRSSKAYRFGSGLAVQGLGSPDKLATTQDVHAIDDVGRKGTDERVPMLVREANLEEYKKHPEFAKHVVHHPPLIQLWEPPVKYDGNKWGMAIDLAKCIGCNACVTACQAENNIAVVGIEAVKTGREMLWLRVDRYYSGKAAEAGVAWQPLPCQQCENAPCEQVCPVGATMHSSEGLNDMVYNRCIGTRYCANNCPYKVRRFNYFNYHLDKVGLTPWHGMENDRHRVKAMVFNPEVTVRARGVMEKCTFCVQRIQNTKIKAKNAKRAIKDQEIQTACQQTCPTAAIAFGNLNDKQSQVSKLSELGRAYQLLGELNNRPRVSYLARVKNPNPELV